MPPLKKKSRRRMYNFSVIAFMALALFYFSYHLVSGENGVMAMVKLEQRLEDARTRFEEVRMERMQLEHRVKRLYSHSVDVDLADEQARKVLGYADKDEVIYLLPKEGEKSD